MGGKPFKILVGGLRVDHTVFCKSSISLPYNTGTDQISKLRSSQSPIAIAIRNCPKCTTLDPLKFQNYWDNKAQATLVNNGATAYFSFEDSSSKPRISGGPIVGEYIFEQMHFHWSEDEYTGCEHVLDEKRYVAEFHLVHYNSKYRSIEEAVQHADGLVVVGFMLESCSAPNPKLDKLVQGFEAIQKKDAKIPLSAVADMDQTYIKLKCYPLDK